MPLLKVDGTMCIVGAVGPTAELNSGNLIFGRRSVAGSLVGGIKETQEMLEFCAKHHIVSEIEMIKMEEINHAYERMLKNDVKYRFAIDMNSLS
jgi:alcohol dehydrogenase (NADP+)